jgi:hypothetical protein
MLLAEDEIPWDEIAFKVVEKTLRCYFQDRPSGHFAFRTEFTSNGSFQPWPSPGLMPNRQETTKHGGKLSSFPGGHSQRVSVKYDRKAGQRHSPGWILDKLVAAFVI